MISNVKVYDLEESIFASGYPMLIDAPNEELFDEETYCISDNSFERAIKLAQTRIGEGHDNFLNGIKVNFDLDFTIKVWTEAERYHFFDFVSSMSTMHRLKDMDLSNSYIEYTDMFIIERMKELQQQYKDDPTPQNLLILLYSNPVGMKLTARMTTNYRQLKTMYTQRKNHRLPEWRDFCEWIETLPCAKELICDN